MRQQMTRLALGLLATAFAWFGTVSPVSRFFVDNCRGMGSQDPVTGKLTYGCVANTCTTGSCTVESDSTSAPGFVIEFCTCRHPDTTLDCDFTSKKCVTLLVTDSLGVKAFWCKQCDCPDTSATEPMCKIKGNCTLTPATAHQQFLCACDTGPRDE